jgi:hypothetical protein
MIVWANQLRDLAGGREVEWSDTWTAEDISDTTKYSLANFEDRDGGSD